MYFSIPNTWLTLSPDHEIKNSRARPTVKYAIAAPAPNRTTEDSTNGIAYFFSLASSAGTTKRQICHRMTGSARMIPPYMPIRIRAANPSVGLNALSRWSARRAERLGLRVAEVVVRLREEGEHRFVERDDQHGADHHRERRTDDAGPKLAEVFGERHGVVAARPSPSCALLHRLVGDVVEVILDDQRRCRRARPLGRSRHRRPTRRRRRPTGAGSSTSSIGSSNGSSKDRRHRRSVGLPSSASASSSLVDRVGRVAGRHEFGVGAVGGQQRPRRRVARRRRSSSDRSDPSSGRPFRASPASVARSPT